MLVGVHLEYGEVGPIVMSGALGLLMAFLAYGQSDSSSEHAAVSRFRPQQYAGVVNEAAWPLDGAHGLAGWIYDEEEGVPDMNSMKSLGMAYSRCLCLGVLALLGECVEDYQLGESASEILGYAEGMPGEELGASVLPWEESDGAHRIIVGKPGAHSDAGALAVYSLPNLKKVLEVRAPGSQRLGESSLLLPWELRGGHPPSEVLFCGAPAWETAGEPTRAGAGKVFFWSADALDGEPRVLQGQHAGDLFGAALAGITGSDGQSILLVGSPGFRPSGDAEDVPVGRIVGYRAGTSTPVLEVTGDHGSTRIGATVQAISDVDGDGWQDFATSANREIRVISSRSGAVLHRIEYRQWFAEVLPRPSGRPSGCVYVLFTSLEKEPRARLVIFDAEAGRPVMETSCEASEGLVADDHVVMWSRSSGICLLGPDGERTSLVPASAFPAVEPDDMHRPMDGGAIGPDGLLLVADPYVAQRAGRVIAMRRKGPETAR